MAALDEVILDNWIPAKAFETSLTGILLVAQLAIGFVATQKIRAEWNGKKVTRAGRQIKSMFFVSLSFVLGFTSFVLLGDIWEIAIDSSAIPAFIQIVQVVLMLCFYLSLNATLTFRLHTTFNETAFRMTKGTLTVFGVIYTIDAVLIVLNIFSWIVVHFVDVDAGTNLAYLSIMAFLLMFAIGSFLSVRYFTTTLNKIAQSLADNDSPVEMTKTGTSAQSVASGSGSATVSTRTAQARKLDKSQQKMVRLSARYILLFVVAIASTFFFILLTMFLSNEFDGLFFSTDFTVNLFCIYAQFGSAREHYLKVCGGLDARMQRAATKKTQKQIMLKEQHEMSSVNATATSDEMSAVNSVGSEEQTEVASGTEMSATSPSADA